MVRLFSKRINKTFKISSNKLIGSKKFQVRQQMKLCKFFTRNCQLLIIKHFHMSDYQETFSKKLSIAYNKAFPYVRSSRKRASNKPWITIALNVSIKEKHKLYQKFVFSQTHLNAKFYKTFQNRLKTLIRKAEINYYLDAFNDKNHVALKKCRNNLATYLTLFDMGFF